ncbi:MAG: PilZ domain-containing protein [Acidobacteriota bacterium]|nr:PilZ domain-containing protein [Acidobacteriota bacterium]
MRGEEGEVPERRATHRYRAEHAARLQFVTGVAGAPGDAAADLWPSLICRTCDVSEAGLGLVVPAVREGDDGFYGLEWPVRVTLGLPTGAVEARGVTARYSRDGGDTGREGFVVGLRITEMGDGDAGRLRDYIRNIH